jgi:hypothetical protein
MKHTFLLIAFALTIDVIHSQQLCHSGDWGSSSTEMAQKIYASYEPWHNHEQRQLFGVICKMTLGRHFFLRQRRWKGEFDCPSLSSMKGHSWNRHSQRDAIEHSIAAYIEKGMLHGFLTTNLLQQQNNKMCR